MSETERAPWTRPREGRILGGVCAAFARRLGVGVWVVRAVALAALFFTCGLAAVAYLVLALSLPEDAP